MSEVTVTASAWVVGDPGLVTFDRDEFEVRWSLRAEASVADPAGEPMRNLSQRAWSVHVTDAMGSTHAPSFTLAKANVLGVVVAGFYILAIPDFHTGRAAPTAFGIVIDSSVGGHKREVHGQVVVPIRHTGPTILQLPS